MHFAPSISNFFFWNQHPLFQLTIIFCIFTLLLTWVNYKNTSCVFWITKKIIILFIYLYIYLTIYSLIGKVFGIFISYLIYKKFLNTKNVLTKLRPDHKIAYK